MLTEESMNKILGEALSQYGNYLGVKKVTSKLPTVAFHQTVQGISLAEMEARIGKIAGLLYKDETDGKIIAIVRAGVANMNPAIVVIMADGEAVHLAAYAKEGLIKQHTAEKAVRRILEV